MTPEQHARAKAIFLAAVSLSQDDREALLARECAGDAALDAEVRGLLSAHVSGTVEVGRPSGSPAPGKPVGSAGIPGIVPLKGTPAVDSAPVRDFPPGTVVADRYRFVSKLGAGGMGEVYRADDLTLEQPVALKFLPREWARSPRWIARLRNEARLARTVTHTHVCRIHDLCEWNGEYFLSMEYVDGEDLGSLLRRIGRLPEDKAVDVCRQICLGLAVAHHANVLHRDLKPANIMLDNQGLVRITDFGIAAVPDHIAPHEIRTGTAAYMAPEQIGGREVSFKSDLYSLGLVMYQLFTGQPAFHAESIAEYAELHEQGTVTPPTQLVPDLPPEVERIILQCLSKNPDERPSSALMVAAALPRSNILGDAIAAHLTPAPDLVAAAPTTSLRISRRAVAVATAVMLVALLVVRSKTKDSWDDLGHMAPSALSERARSVMNSIGVSEAAAHAHGFCDAAQAFDLWKPRLAKANFAGEFRVPEIGGPIFWYRNGDRLDASGAATLVFGSGRVTIDDPPPFSPGMSMILFDLEGRLLLFARESEALATVPGEARGLTRFEPLLRAAGLPLEGVDRSTSVEAAGWGGTIMIRESLGGESRTLALAGEDRGVPTFFVAASGAASSDDLRSTDALLMRQRIARDGLSLVFMVMAAVALPPAWRARRSGRIDREDAARLLAFIVILEAVVVLLRLGPALSQSNGIVHLSIGVIRALGLAALLGSFYLVVDMYARRTWPTALITWNRLARLQWTDADVTRHVGLGTCVGCFWAMMAAGERATVRALGWHEYPSIIGDQVAEKIYGIRDALASVVSGLPKSIGYALVMLLMLVAFHRFTRGSRWAILLTGLVLTPVFWARGIHPATSIVFTVLGGLVLSLWLLTRVGLLALVAALFVAFVLNTTPMTLDAARWYGDLTLLSVGIILVLGLYGVSASDRPTHR